MTTSGDAWAGSLPIAPVSKSQEVPMDLWATLGVSRAAGVGVLVAGLAVVGVVVSVLVRRSWQPQRVQVDLSGRG